jgi:hypothetical protein
MWKDVTSYQRNEERIPRCFLMNVGGISIVLVKGHIHCPGKWVLTCEPFFRTHEILNDDMDSTCAQGVAFHLVKLKLCECLDAMELAARQQNNI